MHGPLPDDDGYRLWLRYQPITDPNRLVAAKKLLLPIQMPATTPTLVVAREELLRGLAGLLSQTPVLMDERDTGTRPGLLVLTRPNLVTWGCAPMARELDDLGDEGFILGPVARAQGEARLLAANTDIGILHGVFALLRTLQQPGDRTDVNLNLRSRPRVALRMLNHWDNLDGTIERGYAGASLWNWRELPHSISPRYRDYARVNASIGLNAVVLNNVNASALILTAEYLPQIAALADVFRPYGIRVFLSARFSAPIELGGLPTADPLDAGVATFWREKAAEIYRHVPDFGGFLVKANSEGQPGPQDYGRSHADGANLLADALAPHGGVVVWRAFVYQASANPRDDRAKQAFDEFTPLDGQFRPNVLVQVKNGPIDFQPREPFHPLFGAMPRTPAVLELQITQEYLGFASHLAYLGTMWEEILDADTFRRGPGSTVAKVVDGSLWGGRLSGIAAVANCGNERNWCGHPFAQANWYAFGRLAWDPDLSAEAIATEWLAMTFTTDPAFIAPVLRMMLGSREAVVDYMTPLGLHHLMAKDHHYGPGPWVNEGRPDWTSPYYHRADEKGLGFDRTASGSGATRQYLSPLREQWENLTSCSESLLLWFHHVPWDHPMKSGRTLWDELCHRYTRGVMTVRQMRETWTGVAAWIDHARHQHVTRLLAIQESEAWWWRNACLLYFQTFAQRPLPADLPPLEGTLAEYIARSRLPLALEKS